MTKHKFIRWRNSRPDLFIVEFEQLFLGNHPDPQDIRSFFMRYLNSHIVLSRIASAPSAFRLLDEDLTSTYDETLWHAVHGVFIRHESSPTHAARGAARLLSFPHLDRFFLACHVPESVLARTHVAIAIRSSQYHFDFNFMERGTRPGFYIETLLPSIRQELCKRRIQGWEDVQWSLPLDVSHLQKPIEPGLLKAIEEDNVGTFAILKTFTRKIRPTLVKIALAHHAWKILAHEAKHFREPMAGISLRSILFAACSHPFNQRASVLIHQLERGSPGIVRQTFDAGGNDPLWYTLYSGLHGPRGQVRWKPLPKILIDTLIAYGCDPARRNRNGISFQAMNAELMSGRDIELLT